MTSVNNSFVTPTSVLQDYSFVITTNRPANILEINPFGKFRQEWDNSSAEALKDIQYRYGNWGHDASLISDIFQYEGASTNNVNSRYFILTDQLDDFEKIKSSAILGAAKTTNMADDGVFIDMIQVNPWHAFTTPRDTFVHPNKPQYRHCGTSIINAFKKIFTNKDLFAHVPKNLIGYFENLGFEVVNTPMNKGDVLMKCSKVLH